MNENKIQQQVSGDIMDPDQLMNGISKEIFIALNQMNKAKTADEKRLYSETIKNLCESLGVFLELLKEMPYFDDEDDVDMPF